MTSSRSESVSDPRIQQLRTQRQEERSGLIWKHIREMLTGRVGASAADNPTSGLDDGYIWVHGPNDRPEVRALHNGNVTTRVSNVRVLVGERRRDGLLEVITREAFLNTAAGLPAGFAATPDVPKELLPFGAALDALRVSAFEAGTLKVNAGRGWYPDANGDEALWEPSAATALNLSSSVPAQSSSIDQECWVKITLNRSASAPALVATAGTAQNVGGILLKSQIADIATPEGHWPLAAVKLRTGDTDETDLTDDDWVDLRFWLLGSASEGDLLTSALDWNRNGQIDTAETVSFEAIGMYKRKDEPLQVIVSNKLATLETMTAVGLNEDANPVIALGTGADSDLFIREIGNVLYEPDKTDGRKYKHFYTGYNAGATTDEKIHYAYSDDGRTWTKHATKPIISARRAEDPYVVRSGDTLYLYAEDKQSGASRIRRWHSSDEGDTWTDDGQVTGLGDCASPTAWIESSTWYMLYERIDATPFDIGLATSSDGLAWTPDASNPVLSEADLSWAAGAAVPDDILKLGTTYYMTFHVEKVNGSNTYYEGLAKSTDLTTWTDAIGAEFESADYAAGTQILTASMWIDRTINVLYYVFGSGGHGTEGIYRGHPILVDTTTKTLSSDAITVDKDFHVVAAQTGTSDDLATLNGGTDGQLLFLQADSGDTITVKHSTGNIKLNGAVDFALSGDKTLQLLFDGTNWSDTGGGASSPLTTKGDLYTRSSSADARLAVGANGQAVTADSNQTTGLRWTAFPELLVEDGATAPPVTLTNEDEDDWLYADA